MNLLPLILAAIDLASRLIERAKQSGELTAAQEALVKAHAVEVFGLYENAPPPPPPAAQEPTP